MPSVELSDATIERLKQIAVPLVDTFDSVVNKAAEFYLKKRSGSEPMSNNEIANVPDLSYTTIHSIVFNGKTFPKGQTYWNHLLNATISEAAKTLSPQEIKDLMLVNSVIGQKEVNGYNFIKEAGVSVQGQNANNAWRATEHIAKAIKASIEVNFSWQDNPKAARPGKQTTFQV